MVIKPEISQALNSLLEEIRTSDDARILLAAVADDFCHPSPGGRSDKGQGQGLPLVQTSWSL